MKLRTWFLFLGILLLSFYCGSCRKQRPLFERNETPETFIVTASADSNQVFYQVNIHWAGVDPDGKVVGFYVAITDTGNPPLYYDWKYTDKSETTVTLQANLPQSMGHTFFVKAVDNEGVEDPTPATYAFFARDLRLPRVIFSEAYAMVGGSRYDIRGPVPRTGTPRDTIPVGAPGDSVYFRWHGADDDPGGYVTGYKYKADIEMGFHSAGPGEVRAVYPLSLFDPKPHSFQVASLDDAGAETFDDSTRAWVINFDPNTWVTSAVEKTSGPMKSPSLVRTQADGDTLNDYGYAGIFPEITFSFGAEDDPRDRARGIVGYSGRVYRSTEMGPPWPDVNFSTTFETGTVTPRGYLSSDDFIFAVRSRDIFGRNDGTPAYYYFSINHAPGVVDEGLAPQPDTTFNVGMADTLGELAVKFYAIDIDGLVTEYQVALLDASGTYEVKSNPWRAVAPVQRTTRISESLYNIGLGTYTVQISLKDNALDYRFATPPNNPRTGKRKFRIHIAR